MILITELADQDFIIGIINMLKKICFHQYEKIKNFNKELKSIKTKQNCEVYLFSLQTLTRDV